MSGKANPYDNALMESFFKTLKGDLLYSGKFNSRGEAKFTLFEYIEIFYTTKRIHSALGYMPPKQFESLNRH
jgi:putative transposase